MGKSPSHKSYSQVFADACPTYMAMGMSYDEYWFGDAEAVKFYRKAYELKRKQENYHSWLQGLYFYEALCDASPIFHDLAKKGTKAVPYPHEPYPISEMEIMEKREREERERYEKIKRKMAEFAVKFNAKKKDGD